MSVRVSWLVVIHVNIPGSRISNAEITSKFVPMIENSARQVPRRRVPFRRFS